MIKFKILAITVLCFLAISSNAQAGNLKIPETTAQLEKLYKRWKDSLNTGLNDQIYNQLTQQIQAAAMTGKWAWGAFLAQYFKLLFTDFVAMSKTDQQIIQNRKLARHFKGSLEEMIMYSQDKDLPGVLKLAESYYYNTQTRITKKK